MRQQRDDYRSQSITIAEGYDFSQYETLRTIEIHHNSRFLSGNKDSLGRERSHFSISANSVSTLPWPGNGYAASFVLNLKNRNWTKDTSFARFLNEMGQTRAKYGGVLVKKTEQGSELRLTGMAWRDMITDQVEVRSGQKPT